MADNKNIENKVEFIQVNSYENILKLACQFNHVSFPMYAFKTGKKYRLMVIGERDKHLFLSYYYDINEIPDYILYNPHVSENQIKSRTNDNGIQDINNYRIEIIPLKKNPFEVGVNKTSKIHKVEMEGHKSLIRMLILKSTAQEYIESVYTFEKNGKRYLAAFNLFPDQKLSSFFYSEYDGKINAFIRYNPKNETVEMVDSINDSSSFHIKLINLSEPFSFA